MKMTMDQIRARRAAIAQRLAAISGAVANESRTLSPGEISEGNGLRDEDESLAQTQVYLESQAASPVQQRAMRPAAAMGIQRVNAPAVLTATTQAQRNGDKILGQSWARMKLASIRAALNPEAGETAARILAQLYPSRPDLARCASITDAQRLAHRQRKASGVEGGGVASGEQGAELLELDAPFTGDFITFLYSQTVFDRMGFRQMPADVNVKGQDGAFTGYFVGDKKPIPVSIGSFSEVTLRRFKAAGLTYLSRDLIERSAPAAEPLFIDGVTQAITQALDTKAFSTDAASSGVNSAGLLQGLAGQASAGGTSEKLFADLSYLTGIFVAAKNAGADLTYVSNKVVANQIAHLLSPLTGLPLFADKVTEAGGVLNGKPYVTGDNVPASNLLLIKPSDIWVVGDSGVRVELSRDATIEADTAPTGEGAGPTAQSANMVSMFQTDMVAIRAIRDVDWKYRRAQAIVTARITAADYDGTASTTD
jgi:hypothetical protein